MPLKEWGQKQSTELDVKDDNPMRGPKVKKIDPLLQLFERYLLTRSYDDAESFTKQLAQDYLSYLDSTPAHVPVNLRETVLKDLESEAHELLVKKMYGCVQLSDYQNVGRVVDIKKKSTVDSIDFIIERAEEEESREQE